jgi:hypothetical protein
MRTQDRRVILLLLGGEAERRASTLPEGGRLRPRLLALVLMLAPSAPAAGQQYVWSVPSGDVLEKGGLLLETYAYLGPSHARSLYLGPRLVAGVGGHVELGLNVSNNVRPTSDSRVELAVKWKPWASGGKAWDLQAGTHVYVPVYHREYASAGYAFGNAGVADGNHYLVVALSWQVK